MSWNELEWATYNTLEFLIYQAQIAQSPNHHPSLPPGCCFPTWQWGSWGEAMAVPFGRGWAGPKGWSCPWGHTSWTVRCLNEMFKGRVQRGNEFYSKTFKVKKKRAPKLIRTLTWIWKVRLWDSVSGIPSLTLPTVGSGFQSHVNMERPCQYS